MKRTLSDYEKLRQVVESGDFKTRRLTFAESARVDRFQKRFGGKLNQVQVLSIRSGDYIMDSLGEVFEVIHLEPNGDYVLVTAKSVRSGEVRTESATMFDTIMMASILDAIEQTNGANNAQVSEL